MDQDRRERCLRVAFSLAAVSYSYGRRRAHALKGTPLPSQRGKPPREHCSVAAAWDATKSSGCARVPLHPSLQPFWAEAHQLSSISSSSPASAQYSSIVWARRRLNQSSDVLIVVTALIGQLRPCLPGATSPNRCTIGVPGRLPGSRVCNPAARFSVRFLPVFKGASKREASLLGRGVHSRLPRP
jgi:hypothetical protein